MSLVDALKKWDFIRSLEDYPLKFIEEKGLLGEFEDYLLGIIGKDVSRALEVALRGRGAKSDG